MMLRINCVFLTVLITSLIVINNDVNKFNVAAQRFTDDFYVTGGAPNNVHLVENGQTMELLLDQNSASGFASKDRFLFGNIDMKIKLVQGNSAGTVAAYYFSSDTDKHDELDFEFLGNLSGQPYILQTNIFASGIGGREERVYLWFDPTADFHTYSVLWTPQHIVFSVDGVAIRRYANHEAQGVAYPNKQPMRMYASLWNGEDWATRGGLDKIDWTQAPFVASFTGYAIDACRESELPSCPNSNTKSWNQPTLQTMSNQQRTQLQWTRNNFMVYDYCSDSERYPNKPIECADNS